MTLNADQEALKRAQEAVNRSEDSPLKRELQVILDDLRAGGRTLQARMDAAPHGATVYSASQGRRYVKLEDGDWYKHSRSTGGRATITGTVGFEPRDFGTDYQLESS